MTPAISSLRSSSVFSFDVWNTLIKANPEYTRHRNQLISWAYGLNLHEAAELYTQTKFFLDQSAEIGRVCMQTHECWELLDANIRRFLRKNGDSCPEMQLPTLINQCERAFCDNLPIFTQETKDLLLRLKDNGCDLGIISNTNFISGRVLHREVFAGLEVFDTCQYSDLIGKPKPHGSLFDYVRSVLCADELIIHVGDNLICDGAATKFGYEFQHCLNPVDLVATFKSVGL